jgi:pilus assembly protein CpaC
MKKQVNIATWLTVTFTILALFISGMAYAQTWEESIELYSGDTTNYLSKNHSLKKIVVGDPDMVHVDVISKDEIVMVGRQMGQSNVLLKDNQGNSTNLNIFVSPDVSLLKRRLHQLFPNQNIEIYSNTSGVILGGTVTGAEVVEQVLRVAQQVLKNPTGVGPKPISVDKNVKKAASKDELATVIAQKQTIATKTGDGDGDSGTGKSSPEIINMMKIAGPQQVMLEVKFAEVTRFSGRDIQAGFSLGGLSSEFGAASSSSASGVGVAGVSSLGSLLVNFTNILQSNVFVNIDNFKLALKFLEEERLAKVLAEPRLVTQSGQEASFLAGGEYPYQEIDNDGNVSLQFKEFGVGLKFTPIVGSDGLITLHVVPSVTDITQQVAETAIGDQPILSTRKLESTVHMRDGQTLALAGLLSENMSDNVQKVPFLGDLPILGALFRSSGYLQNKTDLLVAVTPHIVKPIHENEISFPGEFINEGARSPEDPSQIKQHSFASPVAIDGGGLEGNFGHTEAAQ